MPMLDMPLEKLKEYKGSNIVPYNFDEFWKVRFKDVCNMKQEYSLKRKSFKNDLADYYEIKFKSLDGQSIYAKYICPSNYKNAPVVLEFHDYKQASKGWHNLTRYIALGYAVLAMDCRGQGGKTEDLVISKGPTVSGHIIKGIDDNIENMYFIKVFTDALVLSKLVEQLSCINKEKVITYGRGQGATIALAVAALNKNIKKCSMQNPFLCDYKRVWDMDLDIDQYEGIRYYFRWFDPMHLREKEIFEKLGYIDAVNFAHMVSCKVFLGTGLLNKVSPPSAQFSIFNNLSCSKKHAIFHKHGHELINEFENENLRFMKF